LKKKKHTFIQNWIQLIAIDLKANKERLRKKCIQFKSPLTYAYYHPNFLLLIAKNYLVVDYFFWQMSKDMAFDTALIFLM